MESHEIMLRIERKWNINNKKDTGIIKIIKIKIY